MTSLETQLAHIEDLYNKDKLLQASRALNELRDQLQTRGSSETSYAVLLKQLASSPFTRIIEECEEVHRLQEALHSTENWTLSYEGVETKVEYRREPQTNSHTVRTSGLIRAPLTNVAALIYEADLYEQLFWYVTSANVLPHESGSLMRRASHLQVYAPWPLHKRDAAIYAYACDGLDEDECVVVVSRSIKPKDEIEVPDSETRVVRVEMHVSGFELIPYSEGVTRATFLYNVDPHLQYIPTGLINWAARTLCRWSLRVLECRARDLGKVSEEYVKRMETGKFHEHIRMRLTEYWAGKEGDGMAVGEEGSDGDFDADVVPEAPSGWVIKQLLSRRTGEAERDTAGSRGILSRRQSLTKYLWGGS